VVIIEIIEISSQNDSRYCYLNRETNTWEIITSIFTSYFSCYIFVYFHYLVAVSILYFLWILCSSVAN
jgi:hypothetical protein